MCSVGVNEGSTYLWAFLFTVKRDTQKERTTKSRKIFFPVKQGERTSKFVPLINVHSTGLPGCETGGCNHPFCENVSELNSTYRHISGRGSRWLHSGGRPQSSVNYFVLPIASFGTRRAPTRSAVDSIDRARSCCLSRPRLQVRSVQPRAGMTHPAHDSAGPIFLRRAARGR